MLLYSIHPSPDFLSTPGVCFDQVNALHVALEKWTALWPWKRRRTPDFRNPAVLEAASRHGDINGTCFVQNIYGILMEYPRNMMVFIRKRGYPLVASNMAGKKSINMEVSSWTITDKLFPK